MTKIIDQREITTGGVSFTCTACELDIDVSSFLFDTERSQKVPQTRLAILIGHDKSLLKPEEIPIQMIILTGENKPNQTNPSSSIDTPCVSCGTKIGQGHAITGLKSTPEDITSDTQVEFSNSTICPFCESCTNLYMNAYERMKRDSIDLKTHII